MVLAVIVHVLRLFSKRSQSNKKKHLGCFHVTASPKIDDLGLPFLHIIKVITTRKVNHDKIHRSLSCKQYSLEINYFLYEKNHERDLLILLKGKSTATQ